VQCESLKSEKNSSRAVDDADRGAQHLFCPIYKIMMVVVVEDAYYIDYKNYRKFVETFRNLAKWNEVSKRLETWLK
jgi:superoxide dismutase